jgi:hypothetical protein
MDVWHSLTAWAEDAKDLITIVAGVGGGAFALYKFADEQRWKRKQFAFDYADAIFADPACQLAMNMIDWYAADAIAPPSLSGEDKYTIKWKTGEVATALRSQSNARYSDDEYIIRGAFDAFLNRLERLAEFVRSGTLDRRDFPTSLRYYLERAQQRSDGFAEAFQQYVEHYKFGCTAWLTRELVSKQPRD